MQAASSWLSKRVFVVVVIATLGFGAFFGGAMAVVTNGILGWDGVWTGNNFSCASGYTKIKYHYDCGCSNNATWYVCVPSSSTGGIGGQSGQGEDTSPGTGGGGGGGVGGGESGCFSAETLILMADGTTKQLQEVRMGDKVIGQNEDGTPSVDTVMWRFVHNGNHETFVVNGHLVVTPNHPMRVIRDGVSQWLLMEQVRVGDLFVTLDGPVDVETIETSAALPVVYNLETYPSHTYFAGGYLVHNKMLQQY